MKAPWWLWWLAVVLAASLGGCAVNDEITMGSTPSMYGESASIATTTPKPTSLPTPSHTASLPPTVAPTTPPTAALTPAPPPHPIASYPIDGDQAVPPDRALVLMFDQPMDRTSVEASLTFSPTVVGQYVWPSPDCAVFRPTDGWPAGACEVLLSASASSAQGAQMEQPLRLTFSNTGRGAPVPILMYHHLLELGPDASEGQLTWTVSPRAFDEQMEWLVEQGWHSISPAQLAAYWQDGAPLPPKPIIISLDDGYKEVYTTAHPIFLKTGLRPILFITPHYMGYGAYMNWEQLGELSAMGYAIGAHGYDHSNLREADEAKLKHQIGGSRQLLEERLGVAVDSFCYPFGSYDKRALDILEQHGYITAVTLNPGYWQSPNSPYQLDRLRVSYDTMLTQFAELLP